VVKVSRTQLHEQERTQMVDALTVKAPETMPNDKAIVFKISL
jgi:hypothetical protein